MRKVVWTGLFALLGLALSVGVLSAQTQGQVRADRLRARIEARVERRMARLDRDHDGSLSRDEWPGAPKRFDRLDRNHDGLLTKDELVRGVIVRLRMARRLATWRALNGR